MKEHVVSVCDRGTSSVPAHNVNVHEDGTWSIMLPRPTGVDAEYEKHHLTFVIRIGFWQRLRMLFGGGGGGTFVFKLASNVNESIFFFEGHGE